MCWSVRDGEEAFAAKFKGQKFSAENALQEMRVLMLWFDII